MWQVLTIRPCGQYADDVHEEARPHHLRGLEAAGAVDDGVGRRGHGEHEGVAHTHGTGHHEEQGVGAEGQGHLQPGVRQLVLITRETLERIGMRMLAQAVLEATSVRNVETKAMIKLTRRGSRLWSNYSVKTETFLSSHL